MTRKFLRQDMMRHLRLGKKRKKNQKWRRPKGRDSKMRLKMKGYPVSPSVGYKVPQKDAGKIRGMNPVLVHNVEQLTRILKGNAGMIGSRVGAKKKLEIMKKAEEMNIPLLNVKKIKGAQKNEPL